jgi:branched-chain amino acid transport system substrate-binding protein
MGNSQYEWLTPDIPENKRFDEKWLERYGDHAWDYGAMTYTNLHMLAKAVREAGTTDTEDTINALEKVRFKSPWGEVYFRAYDHPLSIGVVVGEAARLPGERYLCIHKHAKYLEPEVLWPSVEEVKAKRAKR